MTQLDICYPRTAPLAVETDVGDTAKTERCRLEHLLDEMLGEVWKKMDEHELLRLAEISSIQWQETQDRECRVLAGVIWEYTGNVKKIEKLGYVVPWWHDQT